MREQKAINEEQINKLNKKIEQQKQEIDNQKLEIDQQNKKIENQEEKLEKQKEEIILQKKYNKNLENDIKIKNETMVSKTMKMQKKIYEMNEEIRKVKADLNLIKSRGAIKVFIEFFYRGFRLQKAKSNEDKVSKILVKLNDYASNQNTIEVNNMLRCLLKNYVEKLQSGNFSAHNIDKTKPILPQLFKIIEPDGNYKKVEDILSSINAGNIILESIIKREINYFDKDILIKNDNEIYSKIGPEKLYSNFAN